MKKLRKIINSRKMCMSFKFVNTGEEKTGRFENLKKNGKQKNGQI